MRNEYPIDRPHGLISYEVHLLTSLKDPIAWYISDNYCYLHDAREFLNWLSCQLSGTIIYRIVETWTIGQTTHMRYYPPTIIKCKTVKHYPPQPIYRYIKRQGREDRKNRKLYYEF